MGLLINIDNGGTFTDVCVTDGTRVFHAKSITTPHDLTQCFVATLRKASGQIYGEEDLGQLIRDADYLRYSTTSGTNAVVERKGSPVSLLVEAGYQESVYGAADGAAAQGLWRAMVPERPAGIKVGKDGHVDEHELTQVVNGLLAQGGQRLVVALRSAAVEQRVKDILLDRYPRHLLGAIPFLLSYELVQDADDARRTTTAVINAYLHPGMEHFLYGAESVCKQQRMRRPLLIFRNDGNSSRVAKTTALKTWGSGPRGGLEGTIAYAKLYEAPVVLGMDIGGTTTDVSVVVDEKSELLAHGAVDELTTSLPMPVLRSFGLGGSSIIRVVGGKLVIGPESVGAAPGPACFGRGGTHATLTDALLLLGVLDASTYLGGQLKLDPARAEQAIQVNIAGPLKMSTANALMATVTEFELQAAAYLKGALEATGKPTSGATLLAFGGGGPMIVCGIAEAAGIRQVIVPRLASVFSAFGIGFSNLAHEYQVPLNGTATLSQLKPDLLSRAQRDMYGEGVEPKECEFEFGLWQVRDGHAVEKAIRGNALPKIPEEVDARLSLRAVYALPSFSLVKDKKGPGTAAARSGSATIRINGKAEEVAAYLDSDLKPGKRLNGPALIRGDYMTCLVKKGWSVRITPNDDFLLEVS
jgi:N-methylhydantoinase A/oxoprolinase/acetone carboxylase beta subunit